MSGSASRRFDRRTFLKLLGAAALAPPAPAHGQENRVDMVGRPFALKEPASRILLLDAPDMLSMAVLHPDPSRLVVGWANADKFDSDLVRRQYETAPGGGRIPVVGGQTADTISAERIIAARPDLVVTTAYLEPDLGNGPLTRQLAAAGIPVIFSNAASNRAAAGTADDPFAEMDRALRMWGAILGRAAAAEAFIAFVRERLAGIADRLRDRRPAKTYLEVQSTYDDCCWAAGQRVWGDLLALAGGRNLSAVTAPWYAKLTPEQLLAEAPEVYIASGGGYGTGIRPGIGPGLDPAQGRAGLRRLTERAGFQTLPAVRDRRVHGVWTGLLSVPPLTILFVEIAAKWLHPDIFRDLDPAQTLDEINRRFLAKALPGPCWLSLDPAAAGGNREGR